MMSFFYYLHFNMKEAGSEAAYLLKSKVDSVIMPTCQRQYRPFSSFRPVAEKEMMCATRPRTGFCNVG